MSVVRIIEHYGRHGGYQGVGSAQETRIFLVLVDSNADCGFTIWNSGASDPVTGLKLPKYYAQHPQASTLLCQDVQWENFKGFIWWRFTCTYKSNAIDIEMKAQELNPNPLSRPARVSGRTSRDKLILSDWRKIDGSGNTATSLTPILNSANRVYDTAIERDRSRWSFRVSKNYDSGIIPSFAYWDADSVNKTQTLFLGQVFPKRTLKISDLDFTDAQLEQGVYYRTWSFSLDFNFDTWALSLVDRGFEDINGLKFLNQSTPALLNGSGFIATGSPPTPSYISGAVYAENDFNQLPLSEITGQ